MEETNIEVNEVKYEVKSLIEFSSLAKLLFDLSKRQKDMEQNIILIKTSMNEKDERLSNLEKKIQEQDKNDINELQGPKITTNEINEQLQDNQNDNINNNEDLNANKDIKLNPEMISKLFRKVNELEKRINEIDIKTNKDIEPKIQSNLDNINNINNQLEKQNQNFDEINKKVIKLGEDFDKIKIKVEDFNIYDIIQGKGESGNEGNLDKVSALIQALENKVFKKFELYDEKNKKNEEDIMKNSENIKKINELIDSLKKLIQMNSDKIKANENNFNDFKKILHQTLEGIKNDIGLLEEKIPNNTMQNNFNDKIRDLENELNKLSENNKKKSLSKQDQINGIIPGLNKKLEELENSINEIKDFIAQLEKDMNKKITEEKAIIDKKIASLEEKIKLNDNSGDINKKFYDLDEAIKLLNSQFDSLHQNDEKFKTDINTIFAKLEKFDEEILLLRRERNINAPKQNTGLETNNFIHQTMLTQLKKEINSKLEKMKADLEHLSNNLETISSSLNLYPTNKDFSKFQNSVITLIEDFKSSLHKKYMERVEIQKALKLLENQIKSLNESSKKNEGSDTWLLAKKPIGNYMCASCEANLKDLEQKDNYIPWNKYPIREEKNYRLGHGYSRILEMVNEEILKNYENRDNKGYVSDDDKKSRKSNSKGKNRSKLNDSTGYIEKKSVKLPKVSKKNLNLTSEKLGKGSNNKLITPSSPYEITDPSTKMEPKVSKIYKINNRKNFGFFKANTEKNNGMNINMERYNTASKRDKSNILNMNLTMPDGN